MDLLTGATDGIGLALARIYRGRSEPVIFVGRRPIEQLDPSLFTPENYCRTDLSEPDCAARVDAFLDARGIDELGVIVHNAGAGFVGAAEEQSPRSIGELVAVNLSAPIALTQALLPRLRRARGKIALISSVVSALPCPSYAVYGATKAALDDFGRNLRIELRGSGVRVLVIHPGAANTGLHRKSGLTPDQMDWTRFPSAESVAAKIDRVIESRKKSATIGLSNKALRAAARAFPRPIDRALGGRSARPMKSAVAPHTTATTSGDAERSAPTKFCVITGAAQGVGRALADRFTARGYAALGIDVDRKGADETRATLAGEGRDISFLIADLSQPGDLERIDSELESRPKIDLFIHNAGLNEVGRFDDFEPERQRRLIAVNLLAPMIVTSRLLAADRLAPGSALVFFSSLSSYVGYPGAAVYSAAKQGLASYARSLNVALRRRGVHVMTVFPGPTRTAMAERCSPMNDERSRARRMAPERLAQLVDRALERRRSILLPGLGAKLFAAAGTLAPLITETAMRKAIFEKLPEGTLGG